MKILWPWPQGHPWGGDGADKNFRPISTIKPNMNEINQRVFKIWGLINFNAKTLTLCDGKTNTQTYVWTDKRKSKNYIPPYVGGINIMSRNVRKHIFRYAHPAKIQINLCIRALWSESSLGTFWIAKDAKFLHADNEAFNIGLNKRGYQVNRFLISSQKLFFWLKKQKDTYRYLSVEKKCLIESFALIRMYRCRGWFQYSLDTRFLMLQYLLFLYAWYLWKWVWTHPVILQRETIFADSKLPL